MRANYDSSKSSIMRAEWFETVKFIYHNRFLCEFMFYVFPLCLIICYLVQRTYIVQENDKNLRRANLNDVPRLCKYPEFHMVKKDPIQEKTFWASSV